MKILIEKLKKDLNDLLNIISKEIDNFNTLNLDQNSKQDIKSYISQQKQTNQAINELLKNDELNNRLIIENLNLYLDCLIEIKAIILTAKNIDESKKNLELKKLDTLEGEISNIKRNFLNLQKQENFFLSQIKTNDYENLIDKSFYSDEQNKNKLKLLKIFAFENFNITDLHKDKINFKEYEDLYKVQEITIKNNIEKHFQFFLNALFLSYIKFEPTESIQEKFEKFLDYIFESQNINDLDNINLDQISNNIWDLIEKYNDQIKNQSSPLTNDLKSKIQNLSVNINNSTKRSSSGFIFNIDKENGILYIATNKHCVVKNKKSSNPEKVDSLILKIQNHELVFHAEKANIFFPENCKDDIAIIRLQHDKFKNTSQFDGIQINQNVEEGDFVISAGNSLGLYNLNNEKNITQGRIINKNDDQIHHSCALFSGNSGGPLFDSKGNIVGVNYEGGFNESFAIPVKTLMKIFEQHPDNQIKKQKAKDNHQSKLIKNLIGFLAADVLIASATYFTTNKLIEQNKLSEKSMQTIYFGCIGLIAICIACLEIKQIQKNYQEFQQSKIELNKLEEHRNEHSQVL